MKKTIQLSVLFMFAFTTFSSSSFAKSVQDKMVTLSKKYVVCFNKHDTEGLKAFYTTDATRTKPDGTVNTGNEAIVADQAAEFKAISEEVVSIKQQKAITNADGSVTATGTFRLTGKYNTGRALVLDGTYTNTVVKDGGKWKISNSVLAEVKE